jgi:hypothetical protein
MTYPPAGPLGLLFPPPKARQRKQPFTSDEDRRLAELVAQHGDRLWHEIEKGMPGRSARQCRERWNLYLSPSVSNDSWTVEQDVQLMQLHQLYGSKWTVIAGHFPKRTANNVKNRYKQLFRRSQRMARLAPVPAFIAGFNAKVFRAMAGDTRDLAQAGIVVPVTPAGDGAGGANAAQPQA